jgi:hypothetical protein
MWLNFVTDFLLLFLLLAEKGKTPEKLEKVPALWQSSV